MLGLDLNPNRGICAPVTCSRGSPTKPGKLVFAQIMDHLPLTTFRRCVARYSGEHKVKRFSCLDQYLCMAFAQLTYRESLRDIEACLRAQSSKLYHLGIRGNVARNTLANANATRDWRIYCDLAQSLIGIARRLYAEEPLGLHLKEAVYALDSTTIDLCLSTFPWAPFRSTKAAVKVHTLLDLRGNIPSFVFISDGKLHDVYSRKGYEAQLRRIKFNDPQTAKRLVFLTNNFALSALTITQLYRMRWQENSTSESRSSSVPPRTQSRRKSGSQSRFTSS